MFKLEAKVTDGRTKAPLYRPLLSSSVLVPVAERDASLRRLPLCGDPVQDAFLWVPVVTV